MAPIGDRTSALFARVHTYVSNHLRRTYGDRSIDRSPSSRGRSPGSRGRSISWSIARDRRLKLRTCPVIDRSHDRSREPSMVLTSRWNRRCWSWVQIPRLSLWYINEIYTWALGLCHSPPRLENHVLAVKNPVGKIGNNDMGLWDTQPVQKRKSVIESGDMFQECSLWNLCF